MTDPLSPRDWREAMDWFFKESQKPFGQAPTPTKDWDGWCLMDSRMSYQIPPLFLTAWTSWLGADDDAKHFTDDLSEAPVGAALISKGAAPAGHIWIAAPPFKSGKDGGWSNDLVRVGHLDKVHREAPRDVWGHKIIGWMDEINGYDLQLKEKKPPKRKQNKPYKSVNQAIQRLEGALAKANNQKDEQDALALRKEIRRLKRLHSILRHY